VPPSNTMDIPDSMEDGEGTTSMFPAQSSPRTFGLHMDMVIESGKMAPGRRERSRDSKGGINVMRASQVRIAISVRTTIGRPDSCSVLDLDILCNRKSVVYVVPLWLSSLISLVPNCWFRFNFSSLKYFRTTYFYNFVGYI
jgi:hypothetical protein